MDDSKTREKVRDLIDSIRLLLNEVEDPEEFQAVRLVIVRPGGLIDRLEEALGLEATPDHLPPVPGGRGRRRAGAHD